MSEELKHCPDTYGEAETREELLHHLAHCLKNTRESKQMSLEEAALTLKLRTVYLEALESGDWHEMPGEVYALGFLKQYAAHLGLDVSDSIEKLKTGDYKLTKPLTFPDPPISPNRTWAIVAALTFVVLFILFNIFDSGEPEKPVMPPVQTTEMQLAPELEVTESDQLIAEQAPAPGESTESNEPAASDTAAVPPAPVNAVMHEYKLSAVGADVWLQVSTESSEEAPSELLQEALLKSGESVVVRNESPSLILTCGNAAALQIEIDGQMTAAAGSLGEEGKVLRDFRLSAD